jgi:hypothetical protein
MAYMPTWYPDEQGQLHFMKAKISGTYDELAVAYGYQRVVDEDLMSVPSALQNLIDSNQRLFHTDENVDQDRILTQAHRNSTKDSLEAPRKWMRAFARYRPELFQDPTEHLRDVRRTFFFLNSITEAVTNAATYVGGYKTDYRREALKADDRTAIVLADIVDFLLGPTWDLKIIEPYLTSATVGAQGQLVFTERPWQGSYGLDRVNITSIHAGAVVEVARALLIPQRLTSFSDPGAFLLRLLTTPGNHSSPVVTLKMSALQLQVVAGIFSTVEYYRTNYSTSAQASLDTVMDHVMRTLKGEDHRSVVEGTVRMVRKLQEHPLMNKAKGDCGRPHKHCLARII